MTGLKLRHVKPSYGLTDEQIEHMLPTVRVRRERRAGAPARRQRVEAQRILSAARAAIAASPELLTDEDRARIQTAMTALEQAKAGEQHAAIRVAIEVLDVASKDFAARRMNRAFDEGPRGRAVRRRRGRGRQVHRGGR